MGKLLESPKKGILGVVNGFRTLHHVNHHDLEIPKMLLRQLEPKVEVTLTLRDECGPIKVGRLSAFITEKKYILNWI